MKKILVTLFSLLALAGCGGCNQNLAEPEGVRTTEYNKYLQMFNEDIMKLGYQPINFSATIIKETSLNGREVGFCPSIQIKNKGLTYVQIQSSIATAPEFVKIATLYHEIGHCFLGLNHVDGHHLMNAGIFPEIGRDEIQDEALRLELVKDMMHSSAYHLLKD